MFKKRGGHNVKEPDFFVLFCFVLFCFACLFFCLFGGGGAHASQEKRREHKSLPTEYKRGITEN